MIFKISRTVYRSAVGFAKLPVFARVICTDISLCQGAVFRYSV